MIVLMVYKNAKLLFKVMGYGSGHGQHTTPYFQG